MDSVSAFLHGVFIVPAAEVKAGAPTLASGHERPATLEDDRVASISSQTARLVTIRLPIVAAASVERHALRPSVRIV